MQDVSAGDPKLERSDTIYLTVVDKHRNCVSLIQSIYDAFGSQHAPGDLGFALQNRGTLFALDPHHLNCLKPHKRPFHTIIPALVTRRGKPYFVFGVMGGDMQPQGQTQILVNRIDYGLDITAAGDSPRWHHEGSSQSMGEDIAGLGPKGILRLEAGVPEATRKALADLGWPLGPSDGGYGRYECIENRLSGTQRVYGAATEMRCDAIALAY
jgi:gamma-glutamyltranspeptidase/glutathione hydrolase